MAEPNASSITRRGVIASARHSVSTVGKIARAVPTIDGTAGDFCPPYNSSMRRRP
jgi:hypothetical protein